MVGTVIDVTEIKEAEENIKRSEKQLREAQQIAKLGSWELDLLSGRQIWSDEMYRIYGFRPGEIEPDYKTFLALVHPADSAMVGEVTESLLNNPRPMEIDYRIVTSSGRLKFLNADILVEYDENSKPLRMYGSVQDITDIKLVEEELRETNEKLIEAQKELVHNEKLAALGRFSSGIAHEIRNPLANISALAQLLTKTSLDDKSRKHLNYILVNTDIANKIIKDLLNFASPEDLVFKEENISEIIDYLAESARPRCKESGVEIETNLPKELRQIKIDKVKFENAMLNFISNAIDAMPSGGKLTITAAEDRRVNGISIKVIDSGIGISPENIDKILEPFYTTKEEGTGLGLGLAYQTIKSHKGTLNIQSTLGKGTTVEIKLPIS
jgi:PAS domain S-box-containing protein